MMKINLSKEEQKEFTKLLETKDLNLDLNELIAHFLQYDSKFIKAQAFKRLVEITGLSEKEALLQLFLPYLEKIGKKALTLEISPTYFKEGLFLLDTKKYEENPYYVNIKISEIKGDKWHFKYSYYQAFEGFVYNDLIIKDELGFLEIPRLGFFKQAFKYLEVYENGAEWMSITPNEIETMEEPLKEMKGKVLCFGLGLGYFAYMASLKEEVSVVTIIEKEAEVIRLFKNRILPLFAKAEKIKVVQADAFAFLKQDLDYDCVFFDLWHNANDGLAYYLKLKKYEREKTKYYYWIERSILTLLRRATLIVIEDSLAGFNSEFYGDEGYDRLFKTIAQVLEKHEINTYQEICDLLSEESLKLLARQVSQRL